jgi:ATP-dependent RNA helicase DDX10/DBP4
LAGAPKIKFVSKQEASSQKNKVRQVEDLKKELVGGSDKSDEDDEEEQADESDEDEESEGDEEEESEAEEKPSGGKSSNKLESDDEDSKVSLYAFDCSVSGV